MKNSYNEERFKEMFGMSRGTFYYILGKIEPVIVKKHNVKAPVLPDMRLAICNINQLEVLQLRYC